MRATLNGLALIGALVASALLSEVAPRDTEREADQADAEVAAPSRTDSSDARSNSRTAPSVDVERQNSADAQGSGNPSHSANPRHGANLEHGTDPQRGADGPRSARPERIVSASTISDHVLAEIAEPQRVVAISAAATGPATWRFAHAATIRRLTNLEAILELEPDLVLASALQTDRSVARLREAGLRVLDLGEVRAFDSLPDLVRAIGEAIGEGPRADGYAAQLEERMRALRGRAPTLEGLYVGVHGTRLYGGTQGSSYGDVLTAGGIIDVAVQDYSGWPQYSMEQLIQLNPEAFVLPTGDGAELCALEGASALRACESGALLEIDGDLLSDPGPRMVNAAEALRALVDARRAERGP
ncbi:MAG: ABC transporter substrate-binding protein [Myxococcota bacterium]